MARESAYDCPTIPVLEELSRSMATRALEGHAGSLKDVRVKVGLATRPTEVEVDFTIPLRGKTVGDAALISEDVSLALGRALRGSDWPSSALESLQRGEPGLLVGQPESDWLEAKAAPYSLESESLKLEFAKDVVSFANAPSGGLIVLGLETRRADGDDVIRRVRLFDLDRIDVNRYFQILEAHVYPHLNDIEIKAVPVHGNRGYAFIRVPSQPAELKPILVVGHVTSSRILTHYLTVPVRRGAATAFRDPGALHSLLLAGRAALAAAENAEV
jgi:hypothetical protein